jgi:HSP20 family protein
LTVRQKPPGRPSEAWTQAALNELRRRTKEMALVRWDPVRELDAATTDASRLFEALLGNGHTRPRRWMPAMDLVERDDHFLVRADLPGMNEEDVSLEVEDGILTISGERRSEESKEDEGYYRLERAAGRFQRSFSLPEGIDPEQVTAEFDRGVLEIRVPKPAERQPRRIEIGRKPALEGSATER